ncbi:response regulator [Conexibacter arvalis]|uniref:response regulator n=1 Tax=Conexibacter arvalis TaxID=912552 RepID=UPI001609D88F
MGAPRGPSPSAAGAIRVVAADDCVLIRRALADALGEAPELELVAVCARADELRTAIDRHRPDVVVTDIRMPPTMTDDGLRLAAELRRTHPTVGVVVLSVYCEPEYVVSLLRGGVDRRAYLLKERLADVAQLVAAIRAVADGGSVIDARVAQMLRPDGT